MPDIEGLEKHYDVIVLGTGYTGSVLAAAFAQAGKSVLHMDENKCYGNLETAFQFEELLRWCKKIQDPVTTTGSLTTNGGFESPLTTLPCEFTKSRNAIYSAVEYKIYPRSSTEDPAMSASSSTSEQDYECLARRLLKSTSATEVELVNTFKQDLSAAESEEDAVQAVLVRLHNIVDPYMYAPPAPEEEVASVTENLAKSKTLETFAELIKDSRKYSLELLPKLYYFKSDTIDLISQCKLDALTNIRDGVEFYPVKGIYMFSNNKDFVKVPVGRQEIFKETQQNLSMISKRRLSYEEKSFSVFLSEKFNFTQDIIDVVLYAVASSRTKDVSAKEGMSRTSKFVKSAVKSLQQSDQQRAYHGEFAFLVNKYGGTSVLIEHFSHSGFARYGGININDRRVHNVVIDEEKKEYVGLVHGKNQYQSSDVLITSMDYVPTQLAGTGVAWEQTSRAIVIIDGHIHQEDSPATVTIYPPNTIENKYPITLLQYSPILAVCPQNRRVLYLFTKSDKPSAKDDLMQALKTVASIPEDEDSDPKKPNVLFTLFYCQKTRKVTDDLIPQNMYVLNDPDVTIDLDASTKEAKDVFDKICDKLYPNTEYLPTPNEEIVEEDDLDDVRVDENDEEKESGQQPSNTTDSEQTNIE